MADITLSKAVRSNLLNLQNTAAMMGKTQERLSTGLKVNSALDNPTNFFTASGLNSRASDLGLLLDSVSNAVQTIAAADKGISAITKLVESAQATARQAQQISETVPGTTTVNPATISGSSAIAADTGGVTTVNEAAAFLGTEAIAADVGGTALSADLSTFTADGGSFTVNGQTVTIAAGQDDGGDAARAAFEAVATAGNFTVTDNEDGTFSLQSNDGADLVIASTDTAGADQIAALGLTEGTSAATNATLGSLSGTISIQSGTGVAEDITFGAGEIQTRAQLETRLGEISTALGVTLEIDSTDNVITATGTSAGASLTVAGEASVLTGLGLEADTFAADATTTPLANTAIAALTGTVTIQAGNGTAQEITFGSGGIQTRDALETRLGEISTALGMTVSIGSDNRISVTGPADGTSVTIGGDAAALSGMGLSATTEESSTSIVPGAGTSTNPKRAELRAQFDELLSQIDQLAKDSGFNGVNLLNGDDLSVLFNEDGGSKLDIDGVTFNSANLGLGSVGANAFDTNTGINGVLDSLKGAIDTLRVQASKFGSNLSIVETRQDFTKNMINVLETGAANLTLADTNEEAANLLALQTRQQLSSTALSLASQADQNVLRLF